MNLTHVPGVEVMVVRYLATTSVGAESMQDGRWTRGRYLNSFTQ